MKSWKCSKFGEQAATIIKLFVIYAANEAWLPLRWAGSNSTGRSQTRLTCSASTLASGSGIQWSSLFTERAVNRENQRRPRTSSLHPRSYSDPWPFERDGLAIMDADQDYPTGSRSSSCGRISLRRSAHATISRNRWRSRASALWPCGRPAVVVSGSEPLYVLYMSLERLRKETLEKSARAIHTFCSRTSALCVSTQLKYISRHFVK